MPEKDKLLVKHIGRLEVDVPQAVGYYLGVGLAVACGLIEPPIGLFIAAVPLFKMLKQSSNSKSVRLVSDLLEGMSKPIGGDGEAAMRITPSTGPRAKHIPIYGEARAIADRLSAPRQRHNRSIPKVLKP
ncbi:MAG: hypothetical protein NVS4B8_02890 [Herpetosiphon sp.]